MSDAPSLKCGRSATAALTATPPEREMSMVSRMQLGPMLLTPEEAGQVLRVSRSKVYDLMRSRRLQSVKVGNSRRVPVRALELFVEALVEEGTS